MSIGPWQVIIVVGIIGVFLFLIGRVLWRMGSRDRRHD